MGQPSPPRSYVTRLQWCVRLVDVCDLGDVLPSPTLPVVNLITFFHWYPLLTHLLPKGTETNTDPRSKLTPTLVRVTDKQSLWP